MRKVRLHTLKGLARGQANQFTESFLITFWALVEEERASEQMGQKNRWDRGCSGDREPLWGGHGPFGQFSHVQAPLAGLCHRELITVTYLPVHWVPLKISPLASDDPPPPLVSEPAWVGGTEGWAWGPVGALREALRWMGQGCRGGRSRGSGGSCQGHWRELSADFREAGRCSHGNHRPVTSLNKKKDTLGDFCLLPLHPLPGGGMEIWGGGC